MTREYEMVREFMRTFGQEVPDVVKMPDVQSQNLRIELIREELNELWKAENTTEYFDAVLDLFYVTLGAAASAGITPEQLSRGFAEVHRSNMSKLWSATDVFNGIPDGASSEKVDVGLYIVRRADGKVVKPPSYSPANLGPILECGE